MDIKESGFFMTEVVESWELNIFGGAYILFSQIWRGVKTNVLKEEEKKRKYKFQCLFLKTRRKNICCKADLIFPKFKMNVSTKSGGILIS